MKKKILIVITVCGLAAAAAFCVLMEYVYTRDFGVDYKGSARLHYNWKYCSAGCPEESYRYDGKVFAFSYPKYHTKYCQDSYPIWESPWGLSFDEKLLDLDIDKDVPVPVKREISDYISGRIREAEPPSKVFLDWLTGYDEDHYRIYGISLRRLTIKNGAIVLLVNATSKLESYPHEAYVAGITPGGQVYKVRNRVRFNASEASYREYGMAGVYLGRIPPDAARDARSACALKRFLDTLEYR